MHDDQEILDVFDARIAMRIEILLSSMVTDQMFEKTITEAKRKLPTFLAAELAPFVIVQVQEILAILAEKHKANRRLETKILVKQAFDEYKELQKKRESTSGQKTKFGSLPRSSTISPLADRPRRLSMMIPSFVSGKSARGSMHVDMNTIPQPTASPINSERSSNAKTTILSQKEREKELNSEDVITVNLHSNSAELTTWFIQGMAAANSLTPSDVINIHVYANKQYRLEIHISQHITTPQINLVLCDKSGYNKGYLKSLKPLRHTQMVFVMSDLKNNEKVKPFSKSDLKSEGLEKATYFELSFKPQDGPKNSMWQILEELPGITRGREEESSENERCSFM